MRALILRPLLTLVLVLLVLTALKSWMYRFTERPFSDAHQYSTVLFGDSHGNDVPVRKVPRFNRPAQDLVSTWMRMRELRDTRGTDSEVEVVILTIWPMKFSPVAEGRLSGRHRGDGWIQSEMGKAGPLLCMGDLFRSEWPWRLRWQMLLHSGQLESMRPLMGWVCRDGDLADDYEAELSPPLMETEWFAEAEVSRWAMEAIVQLVEEAGWQLLLVEHPMHPSFIKKVDARSLDQYERWMHAFAEAPHVHYLNMGRDSLPNSAFWDFHHLSCEGMEYVGERLQPALEALLD